MFRFSASQNASLSQISARLITFGRVISVLSVIFLGRGTVFVANSYAIESNVQFTKPLIDSLTNERISQDLLLGALENGKQATVSKALPNLPGLKSFELHLLKTIPLLVANDLGKAQPMLQQIAEAHPSKSDPLLLLAVLLLQKGDLKGAQSKIDEALWFGRFRIFPIAIALAYQGFISHMAGDQTLAVAALTRSLSIDRHQTFARVILSQAQLESSNRIAATSQLREGLNLNPKNPELELALAKALLSKADRKLNAKEIKEATTILAGLNERDPSIENSSIYAEALLAGDNPKQANSVLQAALRQNKDNQQLKDLLNQTNIESRALLHIKELANSEEENKHS